MGLMNRQDVSGIIRRTLSHVDKRLVDHGERVAYIAYKMMKKLNHYTSMELRNYCFITLLHDIGAYKTEEIDNIVQFETGSAWDHSIYGYLFVKYLSPLGEYAPVIFYHHLDYQYIKELSGPFMEAAQIVNLADRMDIYWHNGGQTAPTKFLHPFSGTKFSPEIITLFHSANENNCIKDAIDSHIYLEELQQDVLSIPFTESEIHSLLTMLVSSIDFRSHSTVVHSIITTSISTMLGKGAGLSEKELDEIYYGALLHDLGKIGIPIEILEYPGKLSEEAMEIMRTHVNITEQIIGSDINQTISNIALRHHERLDGSGYPYKLKDHEMTISEKVVAVADLMSALSVKRSYKEAFGKEKILSIMNMELDRNLLCKNSVSYAIHHYDEIMDYTGIKCAPVLKTYDIIYAAYLKYLQRISKNEFTLFDEYNLQRNI